MGYRSIQRFAAAGLLLATAAGNVFAQGVTLQSTPSSLTFDITSGAAPAQEIRITSSTGQAVVVAITAGAGVNTQVLEAPNGQSFTPQTLRVTVNPAALGATAQTFINVTSQGIAGLAIPINITGGGTGGGAFNVSPGNLSFTQTGTTVPAAQSLTVTGSFGSIFPPTYSLSVLYLSGSGWLQTSPAPFQSTNSTIVTVTPVTSSLATGTYSATVRLSSTVGIFDVPVTLSVNQAGTSPLTVSPTSLSFTFPAGSTASQSLALNVSSPTGSSVSFTPTLSSNLLSVVQVTGTTTGTPTQLLVSIPFPSFISGPISGSLTLTPAAGSGVSAVSVPVQINSSGTGGGVLSVTPSTLTFSGVVGSTASVPTQNLFVTTSSVNAQFFTATASSGNNFLFVTSNSGVTPGTVTVGVNMSSITTPGTYTGTITLTPTTGTGTGFPTTVLVTVNATSTSTVTANPSSVTLSGATGVTSIQQNVALTSTTAGVAFSTTASTTSGGSWLSATSTSTTLPATVTITANAASLAPGTYTGSVAVTSLGATVATIPVTLTVTTAATLQLSPATLTFSHQTTGTSPPAAQTVQITSSGPSINWSATPTSTGGWLQVSPATGSTPGSLSVSVNTSGLAVGTYTGSVSVTSSGATNSPQTVSVTLNVGTPLVPQIVSVINAASGAPSVASPGLIISVLGTDLGPTPALSGQVSQGTLGTTLGDVRVLFDGIPAPLLYASPTQINAVVPYEIAGRFSTRMQVEARNQRSRDIELRVADTAPGIFALNGSGSGQGTILNQNGSVNRPAVPESRGNVIVIYATGHGQTNPPGTTGLVIPTGDLRRPVATPVIVRIGGMLATVEYAGSAPGLVAGALQVNARIPADGPTGSNLPVVLEIGGVSSQANVTVAIQ